MDLIGGLAQQGLFLKGGVGEWRVGDTREGAGRPHGMAVLGHRDPAHAHRRGTQAAQRGARSALQALGRLPGIQSLGSWL